MMTTLSLLTIPIPRQVASADTLYRRETAIFAKSSKDSKRFYISWTFFTPGWHLRTWCCPPRWWETAPMTRWPSQGWTQPQGSLSPPPCVGTSVVKKVSQQFNNFSPKILLHFSLSECQRSGLSRENLDWFWHCQKCFQRVKIQN